MLRKAIGVTFSVAALMFVAPGGVANASGSSYLKSTSSSSSRIAEIVVHAGAMNRDVPLTVIKPKDAGKPRGVLYLLNGSGGGEDGRTWINMTDLVRFMADKNVYVVMPTAGAYTYYTDWERPDPELGVNKWSTFLGKELPSIIDATYNTSGRNAIGGMSSAATSSLNLAIEHPGRYRAVASFNGCASTTDALGEWSVRAVVFGRGGGNPRNMWGPYGGPGWRAHDALLNADRLRGIPLYISASTGIPGRYDTPQYVPEPNELADQILVGGAIDAGAHRCTMAFLRRLEELRIPATADLYPAGSHSWRYFQDVFHRAWPFFARALYA